MKYLSILISIIHTYSIHSTILEIVVEVSCLCSNATFVHCSSVILSIRDILVQKVDLLYLIQRAHKNLMIQSCVSFDQHCNPSECIGMDWDLTFTPYSQLRFYQFWMAVSLNTGFLVKISPQITLNHVEFKLKILQMHIESKLGVWCDIEMKELITD